MATVMSLVRVNKDLLPPMPECNLQIKANKKDYERIKMLEADVPDEAKRKLNHSTGREVQWHNVKVGNRHWQDKPNRDGHPNQGPLCFLQTLLYSTKV